MGRFAVGLGLLFMCCTMVVPASANPVPGPLSPEDKRVFWGSAEDPEPEKRNAKSKEKENKHFLYCDERGLHVFYPHIKNLGGAYMGVGSDQAYLFIGWQRPVVAWLTDYDPWIRALHKIYRLNFLESKDPEAFIAFWGKKGSEQTKKRLEAHYGKDKDKVLILKVFAKARGWIRSRLLFLRNRLKYFKTPGYVTDQGQYDYVRNLIKTGRVRPMLANLLVGKGVKAIGQAARALRVPIRVLYLSNAEEYWTYSQAYRENIGALYFDQKSQVIRATVSKTSVNKDYRYHLQAAQNYVGWLKVPWVKRVYQMVMKHRVRHRLHFPLSVTKKLPDPKKRPKKG
jgi:hypothetical protein